MRKEVNMGFDFLVGSFRELWVLNILDKLEEAFTVRFKPTEEEVSYIGVGVVASMLAFHAADQCSSHGSQHEFKIVMVSHGSSDHA